MSRDMKVMAAVAAAVCSWAVANPAWAGDDVEDIEDLDAPAKPAAPKAPKAADANPAPMKNSDIEDIEDLDAPKGAAKATDGPAPKDSPAQSPKGTDDGGVKEISTSDWVASPEWYSQAYAGEDRIFNLFTADTVPKGTLVFAINHRTYAPLQQNPFDDFLGFDSGNLKVGLEVRYGALDWLDFGLHRLNNGVSNFDTYQLDARFKFLNEDQHWLNAALIVGGSWFPQKNNKDAGGGFAQLMLTKVFADRVKLTFGSLWHSNSTSDVKLNSDTNWSLSVVGGMEIRIASMFAIGAEAGYAVAGYKAACSTAAQSFCIGDDPTQAVDTTSYPTFTFGPKWITNRHTFSVVVSNNQFLLADGLATNTWRNYDNLVFGFTITRQWDLFDY